MKTLDLDDKLIGANADYWKKLCHGNGVLMSKWESLLGLFHKGRRFSKICFFLGNKQSCRCYTNLFGWFLVHMNENC